MKIILMDTDNASDKRSYYDTNSKKKRYIRSVYAYSVTQLCPALCNPMDCSPPVSTVHGILQARILEWVANSYFR